MNFIKQTVIEMRNILRSRFLLVITIIVLVASFAAPLVSLLLGNVGQGGFYPGPRPLIAYAVKASYAYGDKFPGGNPGMPDLIVGDVTIPADNPFYWNIQSAQQEKAMLEVDKNRFQSPQALDLALGLLDEELNYYVRFAQTVATYQDYRMDLAWTSMDFLYDKYTFDHLDAAGNNDALIEAMSIRKGLDAEAFKKKYVDLDAAARQQAYDTADQGLVTVFAILESNDFSKYVDLRIDQANGQIKMFEESIATLEQQIIDNPEQEDALNPNIEENKRQIRIIQNNTIPILEYRRLKNIIPNTESWQNNALSDVENNRNQLEYLTVMSEDDFNKNPDFTRQYGSYAKYKEEMERQINRCNNLILVAQKSLDADKPDMKYVPNGARFKTVQFLDYSVFVALFAVLLGGWMVASEFQQGTIRLLMIRPKTRTKILLSKFTAALSLSLIVYVAGSILNLITNGIVNGFPDLAFPNYSINGSESFFAFYVPKMLACMLPIAFGFSAAFVLGVAIRNSAVAIVIPMVTFVGCLLATTFMQVYPDALGSWLIYTPIPYVQLSAFFTPYSAVRNAIDNGLALNLTVGIVMLSVLSAGFAALSVYVFRKRDITN